MLSQILIILPIFALILTGWIARKSGALGPTATREINRLVVYFALPALLFDIMANAHPNEIWQPDFILAFGFGCAVVFILTIVMRIASGHHLVDAVIDGLTTSYANVGFLGFPLVLALIGTSGLAATLIATILTACVLFAIAIIAIEFGLQKEANRFDIVIKTLKALVKNPLLIAPALGTLMMLSPWEVPGPIDVYLKLVGGAAAPCALIALGLFLADRTADQKHEKWSTTAIFVFLKLVCQPALTWVMAVPILGMPNQIAHLAILLAALPTGTGPFMLAEFYSRESVLTGRMILSVGTLSIYLALP
jgi:predicted permease